MPSYRVRITAALLAAAALVTGLLTAPLSPATAAPITVTQAAGSFEPVHAKRVFDTRSGLGGQLGQVAPGQSVTVNLADARPVPGDPVSAAVIDVTVPASAPAGSLSVFPSGTPWDHRVTMSLTGGGTIQQRLTVRLGTDGAITIRSNAYRHTHLLVDVLGFYVAGTPTEPGMFTTNPIRVLDTRGGAQLLPGHQLKVALQSYVVGASAAVVNVAVLSAHDTGLLGIADGDGSQATMHLRFLGNRTTPQTMQSERVVKLGSDGTLTLTQSSASGIHLVLDLIGYFRPGSVTAQGGYVATSPQPLNSGQRIVLHGRTPTNLPVSQGSPGHAPTTSCSPPTGPDSPPCSASTTRMLRGAVRRRCPPRRRCSPAS